MRKLVTSGVVILAGLGFLPSIHTQAQSDLLHEAVVLEVKIKPTTRITVGKATLRTPAEMERAEATLGPFEAVEIPFMPTSDPVEYETMKAAANAQAAARASQPLAPEPLAPPTLKVVNYAGVDQAAACGTCRPPDTHGAVGPSHFVEAVNTSIVVFNKNNPGAQLSIRSLQALFGVTEFLFDPRVVFDQAWRRWVIVATRVSSSATDPIRRFYLAVSTTANPAGSYFTYTVPLVGVFFNVGDWLDYPQLGMDQDAVIITGNIFDTPTGIFKFAAMMPIAKARIYNGLGFSAPVFTDLEATLAPPIVFDQNKDAYLVAASNLTHLHLYRGENLSNAAEATLVLQALVDVPDYALPPNAPQPGTTNLLDTLDGRFVNASTQVGDSLWNVHTINLGGFAAPKFYQIDTEGVGVNTIKQQGFFFESSTSHDFNASIAANAFGEVFVTWSSTDVANTNVGLQHNARVRISGRQPADPLGAIPAGTSLFTSPIFYNPSGEGFFVERWGDYSAVSLDPSPAAGCAANRRAWIVNETISNTTTWGTRIARIGFCG